MSKVNELSEHFRCEISEGIQNYAKDVVLTHSRYLFVGKGKNPETYCTHCRYWYYEIDQVKTGTKGVCPNCKSTCTYKHAWRSRNTVFDAAYFLYFEKSVYNPQVVTATWYYASHDLRGEFIGTSIELTAVARMVFDCEKNTSEMLEKWQWKEDWLSVGNIVTPSALRNHNIRRIVSAESVQAAVDGTKLAYSNWDNYFLGDLGKYFALALKYPSVEMLSKLGEIDVVKSKLYGGRTYSAVNWHATKPHNIFKVSKQDYAQLKALDADLLDYRLWQQARKEKSKIQMNELIENVSKFYLENRMDIFKFLHQYTTIHRIFNYAEKQFNSDHKHYGMRGNVLNTWRDYIEDCIKLNMDLSDDINLFPRHLEEAHQKTMKRIKHIENESMRKKAIKRKKELEAFEFREGQFLIKVPSTAKEIIDEGNKLSHCVGGYANRHVEGKLTILFIRKVQEPNQPFYTIELNTKKEIVQVRGFKNKNTTEEVNQFIDIFKRQKLKKSKARQQA